MSARYLQSGSYGPAANHFSLAKHHEAFLSGVGGYYVNRMHHTLRARLTASQVARGAAVGQLHPRVGSTSSESCMHAWHEYGYWGHRLRNPIQRQQNESAASCPNAGVLQQQTTKKYFAPRTTVYVVLMACVEYSLLSHNQDYGIVCSSPNTDRQFLVPTPASLLFDVVHSSAVKWLPLITTTPPLAFREKSHPKALASTLSHTTGKTGLECQWLFGAWCCTGNTFRKTYR